MNYTFLPSFEHIAIVKIATTLWNQSDIRALMAKFEFYDLTEDDLRHVESRLSNIQSEKDSIILKNIEEKIKAKVLLLNIPSSLKEKILCVIKPIGLQIYRWMECNKKSYNLAVNLPDEFSWTSHGTIDRKKTAEALITDEAIDITERYKLACIYCLENYVRALWGKMPENDRASFYSEDDPKKVAQHELVVIWTYDLKGEMAKLENIIIWRDFRGRESSETCTPETYPFKCALIHSNKVAAEYFWSKLSHEDRKDSFLFIVRIYWGNDHFQVLGEALECYDFLHFLLPRVNKHQIALFKIYPMQVLLIFLQWPWQSLFMDMTNHVVLNQSEYWYLLNIIVRKVNQGYKDYDYQRLFGEFWQKSTEDHKKHVIGMICDGYSLLYRLFQNKDKKNISIILKYASIKEKAAIYNSFDISSVLYREKEFDMLEFFIKEFISSHEMLIKLKGKCMKRFSRHNDRLEKFLDDLIQKFNLKRSIEEGHCSSAKRLCSSSDM